MRLSVLLRFGLVPWEARPGRVLVGMGMRRMRALLGSNPNEAAAAVDLIRGFCSVPHVALLSSPLLCFHLVASAQRTQKSSARLPALLACPFLSCFVFFSSPVQSHLNSHLPALGTRSYTESARILVIFSVLVTIHMSGGSALSFFLSGRTQVSWLAHYTINSRTFPNYDFEMFQLPKLGFLYFVTQIHLNNNFANVPLLSAFSEPILTYSF